MTEQPLNSSQFPTPEAATSQVYKNWRERFAVPLLAGVLLFGAVALVPAVIASQSIFIDAIFITAYLITGLVTAIRFSYLTRMSVFLGSIFVIGLGELLLYGILGDSLFFFLAAVVFATILLSPRAGMAAIAASILTIIVVGWLMLENHLTPLNPESTPSIVEDWISAGAAILMFGSVIILGFQRLETEFLEAQRLVDEALNTLKQERNSLEDRVQERTRQLRKINQVERAVASILSPDQLLPQAASLIEKEFDCYFTAFYLLDVTGQWAELREASGEAGKVLKESGKRVDVNGKSPIAEVIRSQQGQIIQDIQKIRVENPLLPYTRAQIVLPLVVGEQVLGALDIHSNREDAFSQQDLDAYQNMASGIAIALENSNLFQEARQSLQEMYATQRQYVRGAWRALASNTDLEYALGDAEPADGRAVEIPLSLRDEIIGQIQMTSASEWTEEQKSLVEAIASQATLALENARLVEESQAAAAQERLANEIIAKIWASGSMDSILQTAARELGRSLEATEVQIELGMDETK